jgi:hypothetical protein
LVGEAIGAGRAAAVTEGSLGPARFKAMAA